MTKTFNIPIEGLPDGWRPVAYRPIRKGDYYLSSGISAQLFGKINIASDDFDDCCLIVEKIQPRRIVLEETNEFNKEYHDTGDYWRQEFMNGDLTLKDQPKIWREVDKE